MKNNKQEKIKELKIDEWIWIIFIILSILNITGDEIEKDYYQTHNPNNKTKSKKIFQLTVLISLIIYIYLANKNYQKYKTTKQQNQDAHLQGIRLFASILIVIASAIVLYVQIKDTTPENPSIE